MIRLKIIIALSVLITCLTGLIWYQTRQINKLKTENTRIENNFYNLNQEMDSVKNKNGTYHYTVETLELTKKELEKTNKNLVNQIGKMRLKIKNLESVTNLNVKYVIRDSMINTNNVTQPKDSVKTYLSRKEDDWIKNSWKTTIDRNGINISDYQLELRDSIITPVEIEYCGWWIFKRAKGVKIHVQSLNPYSQFEKIEYIKIR